MAKHINASFSELFDSHQQARKMIFEYFGYNEDWVVYPMEDSREYYWYAYDQDEVVFCDKPDTEPGDHYAHEIYHQRFLPKAVYEGKEFTMIVVDTHTDGNKFLQIFDNSKKMTEEQAERLREY